MKTQKFVNLAAIALAGSSLLLFGCGQGTATNAVGSPQQSVGGTPLPAPGSTVTLPQTSAVPTQDLTGIPSDMFTAMSGTYGGDVLTQIPGCDGTNCFNKHTYTATLNKGTIQGQGTRIFPVVTFQVDGQQMFQSAAELGQAQYYAGYTYYPLFARSTQGGDTLISYSYGLEIMLAVRTGSPVDSAHSAITIKDCGLSQACEKSSTDAYIASLVKR